MARKFKPAEAKADVEAEVEEEEEEEIGTKDTNPAWSMSVPDAGRKYFNLGKKASYDNSGSIESGALIPTVRAGRLLRALPRIIERRLAGDT